MTEAKAPKWYFSVWFVLLMLFVVLGPFGFPLLWKSPRFNQTAKIALTVIVVIYTSWLVVISLETARVITEQILQFLPVIL